MHSRRLRTAAAALLCLAAQLASAAELRVLSAGAIEPGLRPVLAEFERSSGHSVKLSFATAPQIREKARAGAEFDVVIAPPAVLDELDAAHKLDPDRARRVTLGRVGIGVAVRPGAPLPDITSADAFKRSLQEADTLVFNRASTGLYLETLLTRLAIAPKAVVRYPDGAAVMEHVLHGQGREIGLGAITEIRLLRDKGLQFVGPLPPGLQNETVYRAAAAPGENAAARALLVHLASAPSRATLVDAGIAPAP